ncbi:MAG: response regulator [Rhodospirillales bacterium]
MSIIRPTPATVSLRDVSVLIVEDSIVVRGLLRWTLRSAEAGAIREAANGDAAMRVLETYSPDVILYDWRTPTVEALRFVREVRDPESGGSPFTRIVVMSRCCRCRQVLAARDAGIDEFLVKPLSRAELLAGIRAVIDHPRPFSRTDAYFGPDRRRKQITYDGPERRKADRSVLPDVPATRPISHLPPPRGPRPARDDPH